MKSKYWSRVLAALAFAVVPFVTFADSGAWKQDLTVAGYSGAETLTDFPVLVRLPATFPYADCGEGGETLRFTDADETVLSHEIDTWNPSGESLVWVKLPSLAPSGTTFSMFFGDTNPYVGVSVDSRQTWSRYAAVVHGGTTITGNTYDNVVFDGSTPEKTGDVHDSSPNDVSVKMFRNGITKTTTDGYLGSCFERSGFTAGSSTLGLGVGNPRLEGRLDDIYKFSISGWYKASGTGTYTLAGDGKGWGDNTYFWLNEGGTYHSFATKGGHNGTSGKWACENNVWRHFEVTVIDKDYVIQYRDGEAATASPYKLCSSLPDTTTYNDSHMSFGALRAVADSSNNKNCWMGLMDELRVFNGTASADWVKAEFETASKADFLTMGEIEAYVVDGPDPIVAGFVATATSFADATVSFNVPWAGAGAETVEAVLKYGLAADALTETLDLGQITGEQVVNLPLLTPGATYYFELTVDNGLVDPVVKETTLSVAAESFPEISASGSSLPAGYTQLKYIESTGKQRIPLNVYPELGWSMEMDFMVPAKESGKAFFGCSYSSTSGNGWCLINNSQFMWDKTDRDIWKYTGETMDNMLNQDLHMWLDESGIVFSSAARTYPKWYGIAPTAKNGNYQFALFTTYNNYSSYYSKYRLYGFKIYDATGALVRDLVPATEQSTGYHGVYDKVEGKFYGSDQNKTTAFNVGTLTSVAAQLTVAGVSKMGAALMATVVRPDLSDSLGADAGLDLSITVYYGDTYGGDDPAAWAGSAAAGAFEEGALSASVTAPAAGAKFVRYYSPVGGWSPVVLPEAAPELSAADPLVLKPAVAEVGPCFAKVSLPVLAMGEGATGFSVEAICARGAAEIVQTVATDVTAVGTQTLTVPLASGAAQSIKFRVTNNLGQMTESAAVVVTTPAEDGQATVALPDGGTTLEYVESSPATGALYVDTGYIHNNDTKIVCVMSTRHVEWSTGSNWYSAFGAKRNSSPRGGIRFAFRCAQYLPYTMCCSWAETTTTPNIGTKFFPYATKVQVVTDAEAGGVCWQWQDEVTGELHSDSIAGMSGDRDGQCPLLIFAANETDTKGGVSATNKAYMKLYRFMIYERGELVHDYVPARNASGKVGLYDRIAGAWLYGDKDLAAGPEAPQPLWADTLAGAGLVTTSVAFDGTTLEVGLSRSTPTPTPTAYTSLKVCYGATAGGSDMAAWEHVETLAYGFAAGQSGASAAFAVPTGTKYVRFYSERDGWSDTITVPYLAVTTSSAPAVSALAMTEIGAYAGELAFNLTSLGAGADHCDLKVVYGHDEFAYTNVLPAVTATGPQSVTVHGLVPSMNYTLKVLADNSLADGAVETDAIAFTTAAETYPVAKAVLPENVTLLTYIESTGKQWIDTGLKPALGDDLTLDLNCYLVSGSDKCLMGTANANDGTWRLRVYNNLLYYDGVRNGSYNTYAHPAFTSSDWKKDIHLVIDSNDRVTVEIAGKDPVTDSYERASRSNHKAADYNLALFGVYGGTYLSTMRLYDCTFCTNGVPVRAFYPAQRVVEGKTEYGLLDIVNGEWYADKVGTTLFNIGEVRELVPDSAPAAVSVLTFGENFVYDGATVTVELNRDTARDFAETAVFACFGVNAGDLDRAGWDKGSASIGAFGADAATAMVTIPSIPAGARYVRFCTSSGVWSPVIFLPECPKTVMVDPMLIVSGVSDVLVTSARFAGTVPSLGEGASEATLHAYIQPVGLPEVTEQEVLTISADAASPAIDFFVLGLDPGLAYTVRFQLVNDLGATSEFTDEFVFTTLERNLIDATVSGDDTTYVEKTFASKEKALVFTNGAATATFEVTQAGYAEVLLVGGGGGGGTDCAGGGGAGGYLHFDNLFFPAGAYTITVGAGGAKGASGYGGRKGGDTSIAYVGAGEFATITAYGGAGGAAQTSGRMQDKNLTYGSTGGGANARDTKTHSDYAGFTPTYGQGNYGGKGTSGTNNAGGGGGAGTEGQDGSQQGGAYLGGAGGDGIACAISGETLYYAGGGGGYGKVGGAGGLGGGGRGYSSGNSQTDGRVAGTDGADGLGGGGGGGSNAKIGSGDVYYLASGNGGSGTVILRFVPYSDDIDETPVASLVSVEGTVDLNGVPGVALAARVVSVGAGDAAKVELEYGFSEDRLIKSAELEAGCPLGDYSWRFVGLRAETAYFARLKLTDEEGTVAYSRILPFTTPAGDETGIDPARPLIDAVGQVGSENARITLQVSGTALKANETAEARLFIGTTPANFALDPTASVVSQDAGSVVIATDAIEFGTTYYYVVEVNNGLDISRSEPISFRVVEVGEIQSGSVRFVADPENPDHLIVVGTVNTLGVGSSVARLYLGISQDALTEYASMPVSEAGEVRFESEIANGAYYVKIALENTVRGSKRTTESSVVSGVVADRNHYLWCGEDGLWDEPSNWTVNGEPAIVAPNGAAAANGKVYGPLADFPAGVYTIDVDQDLNLGTYEWDGNTRNNGFNFTEGANVTLRSTKEPWIRGNGVNGLSLVSPKSGTLVLDGVSYQPGQNTSLNVAQGSTVILTNGTEIAATAFGAVSVGQNGRLVVCEGAVLRNLVQSDIAVTGAGAELRLAGGAIDNPTKGFEFGNGTTFVLEGASAHASIGSDNTLYCNAGATATGTVSFVVAPGGYAATPLVLAESNGSKAFGATGSGKVLVSVDPASPAVTFDGDTETMLVTCKKGISFEQDGGKVVLGELPEGAEYFYTYDNTEAREGVLMTGVGVKILGRGLEPAAPLVTGLRNRACTETSATLAFTGRLGGGTATSATYAYRFAAKGAAMPGDFTALGEQDTLVKDYEIALEGLAADTVYTLEVKGVSSDGERIVAYDFSTVCEILEVASASGLTLGTFGPYTDIDYVSGSAEGALVLTRGGAATVQGETKNLPSGAYTFFTRAGVVTLANAGGEAVFTDTIAEGEKVSLRLVTREIDNAPIIDVAGAASVVATGVKVPVVIHSFGGEKTTASGCTSLTATLKWGYHPDHLTYTATLGTASTETIDADGNIEFTSTDSALAAAAFVYAQVVGDNGEQEGVGASRVFTIRGTAVGAGTGSLYQYHKTGNAWYKNAWDFENDQTQVEVRGPMAALYGSQSGHLDGQTNWTDVDGNTCQNWKDSITFAYVGYMYLDAATYTFGGSCDDNLRLTVYPLDSEGKGTALVTIDMSSSSFKTGSLTVEEPGWYPVEIRAGNGSGGYGAWAKYISYNTTGATGVNDAGWLAMLDSGEGELFSTVVPQGEAANPDATGPAVTGVGVFVPDAATIRFTATTARADGYTLLLADDKAMTVNRREIALSATGEGTFDFAGDYVPKAVCYAQFVATNAAGKAFAQAPVAVTIPQEAYFKTGPTVTTDQAMLNVTGVIAPGLGETTVLASFRIGVGTWSEPQAIACFTNGVSAAPWRVAWSENFTNDWGNSVSYRLTISNATTGASWSSQVDEGAFTVKDTATYTWIANDDGNGTAYFWGDPANWACTKPESAIGYPTATASIAFNAGGTADVTLDADQAYKNISFSGAGTRVVFVGPHMLTGPANSGVTTCSGATPTVGVKDGATWRVNGDFQLGASGTTVLVDNATLHVNNFLYDNGNNNWSGTKLVLKGARPQLVTQGYFGSNKQSTAPFTVVLEIPYAGWNAPVIVGNGLSAKYDFAQAQSGGTCKIHFEIDPKSEFLKRGVTKKMTIVDWAGVTGKTFNTANMEMTDGEPQITLENHEKLTKKFLFGFDKGNQLRLTLRGHGGFVIYIE